MILAFQATTWGGLRGAPDAPAWQDAPGDQDGPGGPGDQDGPDVRGGRDDPGGRASPDGRAGGAGPRERSSWGQGWLLRGPGGLGHQRDPGEPLALRSGVGLGGGVGADVGADAGPGCSWRWKRRSFERASQTRTSTKGFHQDLTLAVTQYK